MDRVYGDLPKEIVAQAVLECPECGFPAKLFFRDTRQYVRCLRPICGKVTPPWKGTFFENSNLEAKKILCMVKIRLEIYLNTSLEY